MAMMDRQYEKQPWEQETVKVDWTDRAGNLVISGYAVAGVEVKCYDGTTDVTADILQGSPWYNGFDIFATFKGGADGKDYFARYRVTLAKQGAVDQQQEADLLIRVRQKGN